MFCAYFFLGFCELVATSAIYYYPKTRQTRLRNNLVYVELKTTISTFAHL